MAQKNPESEWFGYQKIEPEQKSGLVDKVFSSVANRYDIMNDAMSLGIHRLWKDKFISMINPQKGQKFLDVAGGTGDIAFRIRAKTDEHTPITVFDLNQDMLDVGKDRAIDKGYISSLEFTQGTAEKLPFEDNSFDTYTISFGLRNVPRIDDALAEAYRVLKPGGQFWCLEFSQVESNTLAKVYDIYSEMLIPRMGKMIAGDSESYEYLVESIRKHPDQETLAARIKQAGFETARYKNLSGGIVAIHRGVKA